MCCTTRDERRNGAGPRAIARGRAGGPLVLVCLLLLVAAPFDAAAQDPADTHWDYLTELAKDGRDDLVVDELEAFVRDHPQDPRSPDALMRWADLAAAAGRTDAMFAALERVATEYPGHDVAAAALLRLARREAEDGRNARAAGTYRRLLTEHPLFEDIERAQWELGRVLARDGHANEARRIFARLVGGRAADDVAAEARFEIASIDHARGARSRAIRGFEEIHRHHPGSDAGARGLLRAASAIAENGAAREAIERLDLLLRAYGDRSFRVAAELEKARLLEEVDPAAAADAYAAAIHDVAGGAKDELVRRGLVRASFAAGRDDRAIDAARAYLHRHGLHHEADHVRWMLARAELDRGDDDARTTLIRLGRRARDDVAFAALAALGERAARHDDHDRALDHWRDAERRAPTDHERVQALLEQADACLHLDRAHLAADLAATAHDVAPNDRLRARALLAATRAHVAAKNRGRALETARRVLEDHPLTDSATQAQQELRRIEGLVHLDPAKAATELGELASLEIVEYATRSGEVATIHRERLGDFDRAKEYFELAIAQADRPEQRGRYEYELGRTLALRAHQDGLRGDERRARAALGDAAECLEDAMKRAGREESAQQARILSIALDLAAAVLPDAPWAFDGMTQPLYGAVGATDGIDLGAAALDSVRRRLDRALDAPLARRERAWILWRQSEIVAAPLDARIDRVREALESDPDATIEPSIRTSLALYLSRAGRRDASASEFTRVLRGDATVPVMLAARLGLGEVRRSQGRFEEAARLFDEVATVVPGTRRGDYALLLAGDCALYAGATRRATDRYDRLLDDRAGSAYHDDALYRTAVLLERSGFADAARDPLQRLVESTPRSSYRPAALEKLARGSARQGRFADAIAWAELWIADDGRHAARRRAWSAVATWSLELEEEQAAILWLDRRLRHAPPDPQSLALRVRAHARSSDIFGARHVLRRLEDAFPDARREITLARLDVTAALEGDNQLEEAVDMADRARRSAPSDSLRARTAYEEGNVYARLGYGREAVESWSDARAVEDPTWSPRALFATAEWASHRGDAARAEQDYDRFVIENPHHPRLSEALHRRAASLLELGRHADALPCYQRVLETHPDRPGADAAMLGIARCHFALGQDAIGVATMQRVMGYLRGAERADAIARTAEALERLGRDADAARMRTEGVPARR